MSSNLVRLFIQYAMAVFIACIVSYVFLQISFHIIFWRPVFSLIMAFPLFSYCIAYAFEGLIGFSGVFSGTFCLERHLRKYGSIFLLVVVFCIQMWWRFLLAYDSYNQPSEHLKLLQEIPFVIGGLIAVLLFWRNPRRMA